MPERDGLTRLRALADGARQDLSGEARERLAQQVAARGPGLLRRARRTHRALQAGGVLVALAALLALSHWRGAEPSAPVATHAPRLPPPAPTASTDPAVVAAAPACASRAALTALEAVDGTAGAQRIALGAAGLVVADASTTLWLDAEDPCRLRVRLQDGKVFVHAADLGGGELRVSTPSGEVLVHGTAFAVAHAQGELVVDVHEGRVSVAHRSRELAASLVGGQRLRARSAAEPIVEPLPQAAREQLQRALAEPAAESTPAARATASEPRPAEALVQEAEALWRAGELERARARYRQAGGLRGPTAEAAWLALARRELALERLDAAQAALDARAARFAPGTLAGEAAGIAFRVALASGDDARIRVRAEALVRSHPQTPQGRSAAQWLREHAAR